MRLHFYGETWQQSQFSSSMDLVKYTFQEIMKFGDVVRRKPDDFERITVIETVDGEWRALVVVKIR